MRFGFWVLLPAGGLVLILATLSIFVASGSHLDVFGCHLVAIVLSWLGITSMLGFFIRDLRWKEALLSVAACSALTIVSYAVVYQGYGIASADSYFDYLYFSIVTWTGIGNSVYQPPDAIKFVTAIEALTGYLFLGPIIASIVSAKDRGRN